MPKEMKRPTSHISGNSIKPALSKAVEFYTDNNRQAYECIHERDEYIDYLESKLSNARPQQALPVVPECVAVQIERVKNSNGNFATLGLFDWNHEAKPDYTKWIHENVFDFMRACTIGYTVEKPQLFYLREKNTNYYLNKSKNNGLELVPNPYFDEDNQFTKQEIDSMETGSYELVPVEDGE